jgi:hypothetical protein
MITVEQNVSTETEKEDDLVYAVGVVTNHQDIGFTPFFGKNIKKLRAPLPLTIFDREWQKEALSAHLSAKPSKSTEDKAYWGHPYHNKWNSKWTNNHRIFHLTLRDVYNKKLFADKLLIHKMNCDAILDKYGFMTCKFGPMPLHTAFNLRMEQLSQTSLSRRIWWLNAATTTYNLPGKLDGLTITTHQGGRTHIRYG